MKGEPSIELITLLVAFGKPGRLPVDETGKLLNFTSSDIGTLMAAKLLKPLGNPAPNAPKFFATVQILALECDEQWLNKATRCCSEYWRTKRRRAKSGGAITQQGESA